jgi:hypothetical protein
VGNKIGTDLGGFNKISNLGTGVVIRDGAFGTVIETGVNLAGETVRNLISGNNSGGIRIGPGSSNTTIYGT